ncbi:unnamed protein product [Rodentolepis nana]|uniref:Ovule protein n=1 Tax=Rodentolepis nana TaxID=102285 RepID=A0A0R3T295_RODNA|nr:unnamed protein product [Rodentolepis nana]
MTCLLVGLLDHLPEVPLLKISMELFPQDVGSFIESGLAWHDSDSPMAQKIHSPTVPLVPLSPLQINSSFLQLHPFHPLHVTFIDFDDCIQDPCFGMNNCLCN